MNVAFRLNGANVTVNAAPERRLVDVLREEFGLTATKAGCSAGECGACTVLFDGDVVLSCLIPAFAARGADVTTLEGIAKRRAYREIVRGFTESGYRPCSFCFQGRVLSLYSLLERIPAPNRQEIDEAMLVHTCRCNPHDLLYEAVGRIATERRTRQRAVVD